MKPIIKKECDICHELFEPKPQVAKRQNTCNELECKLKHKSRYNEQWRGKRENADYFKGRYLDLQQWLELPPGYLRNYREQRKAVYKQKSKKSNDIQVELTPINNNKLCEDTIKMINDIQVELNTNINNMKQRLQKLYFDIQVE